MRPADTSAAADAVQIELLRRATPERRSALALSLSQTMLSMARRAIREAYADLSKQEQDVKIVTHFYGPELGEKFRRYLEQRQCTKAG
jgi:hypothetical protein